MIESELMVSLSMAARFKQSRDTLHQLYPLSKAVNENVNFPSRNVTRSNVRSLNFRAAYFKSFISSTIFFITGSKGISNHLSEKRFRDWLSFLKNMKGKNALTNTTNLEREDKILVA